MQQIMRTVLGVGGGCVGGNRVVKDKGSEIERGEEMGTVRR